MEVKRTMKNISVKEYEFKRKLDSMLPNELPGRHQILTKLKDLVVNIDAVSINSINSIPVLIKDAISFFSTDGFWVGNFIAFGYDLKDKKTLLWDDFGVLDIVRDDNVVYTNFIKERLSSNKDIVIVTAKQHNSKTVLNVFWYIP